MKGAAEHHEASARPGRSDVGKDRLRILTFNRHEANMYELAKTNHEFHVLLVDRPPWEKDWDRRSRPTPANVKIIGGAEDIPSLDLDQYDLLLAQAYDDLSCIQFSSRPKMLLLMCTPVRICDDISKADALRRLYQEWQMASIPIVYASGYYAHTWGLPGRIIPHAVDARDYKGFEYTGEIPVVLTVVHYLRERDDEMGYTFHRQMVRDDIPYKIIGYNPTLPDSGPARDWSELKSHYRHYRVYLNTARSGGFIALIEAMTAGMPVVTRPGPAERTPHKLVIDGYNGFVSDDPQYLREKIKFLLANPEVAKVMGQRAKESAQAKHSIERFTREWQEAFADAISKSTNHAIGNLPKVFYEKAGLVSDPKASLGRALFWPARSPKEHLLYGPFIRLAPGQYEITFYVRLGEKSRLHAWASSFVHARLSRFHPKWGEGDPLLAVLDICSGPEPQVHAHRALHRSHFRPWGSYQGFKLTFDSRGEKFFQFRVFATGSMPLYVDLYRTWASIQIVGHER